ncbi:MAG: hypothetical protein A2015_12350 [Spirochaetes bacterium GWF1_31_7]|nr:MAG: hypothetical protein A2Y30_09295 [Spirochaetes bacterium GWE1_32_154]OHD49008.1 MAG: hypothetical protein A2Y29_17195 [Spirochaetes bacterium GWE2_31_10]OHD49552.1 MAG: hypothetical protein A2015_12350 [Spirochaetes bacterium GWF1_31_7]OHD80549.1 MAG: hypothetical protein A2355_09090 [Spirochaetes bacterium RIFOXYB1_FULL_32_8]
MKNKIGIIVVFVLLSATFMYSNEKKELEININDAVDIAITNNIEFKSKQIDQKSNEWKLYSVWNTFLPSISLSGNLIKSNLSEEDRTTKSQIVIPTGPGQVIVQGFEYTRPEWSAGLGFNLSWTFNAAMIFGAYQTGLDYQKGILGIEEAKKKLAKNVKQTYYGLMIQEKELEIKRVELKSKEERYKQAQTNFKNGLIPRLLLLRSQVAYETTLPSYTEKENNYANNLAMFKFLLGLESDTALIFKDPFEAVEKIIPEREKLINLFDKNNITLRNLYIAKGMVNNGMNSYISSLTPSFQLSYTNNPAFMKDPMKDDWFSDVENDWKDQGGSLRLSMILPISDWIPFSKNQVGIIGSDYANKKMNQDIKAFQAVSYIQIDSSLGKLEKAIKNINSVELSVQVAEEAYKLARDEFKLGTKELLDVQDTESDVMNFKLMKLYAEYEYINNLIELEYLVNTSMIDILK